MVGAMGPPESDAAGGARPAPLPLSVSFSNESGFFLSFLFLLHGSSAYSHVRVPFLLLSYLPVLICIADEVW